jgi:alkylation response protein AidB-like acyl-CoA dehydrogenase
MNHKAYTVNFEPSEEQVLLRNEVRRIAKAYGHKYYVEQARSGGKMTDLWRDLGQQGYLGVNLPEAYGGGGMGISELAVVCEELSAQGCPILLLIVSPAICGTIIARYGTDDQKAEFLPGLASAEQKMAFAITEPDAGSNSHDLATVAEPSGDGFKLRGTKYYISGADEANNILVVSKTGEDPETGRGRLGLFVVDPKSEGVRIDPIPVEITAPEKQFTVFFDDVFVPRTRLIGTEGEGLKQVFTGLVPERITGAAIASGIGMYALEKGAAYARERVVWNVPIGAHQGIAHPLAKAKIELELARLITQKAAWLFDNGRDAGEAANMAKYSAAEAGLAALDQAIQTHGGNGLATEYGLATLWGMARLLRTAPVSREMVLNYIAIHTLGLPKSYGDRRGR